jgi:hypothetical protein
MKSAAILAYVALATVSVTPSLFGQARSRDTLPENHFRFTLHRIHGRFQGGANDEFLRGFTVSMILPHRIPDSALSLPTLMQAVRRGEVTGFVTYPTGTTTRIVYEIAPQRGAETIYMKTSLGYFLWESTVVRNDTISFVIDWWYTPPVRTIDVEVVAMAESLLADSTHWHKRDDRLCTDDRTNDRWSLFCALQYASMETTGEYNHHSAVMNTVRLIIFELVPQPLYEHPLMDYNNAESTTHHDILRLLAVAKQRLNQAIQGGRDE